jgi:hypothetical protein
MCREGKVRLKEDREVMHRHEPDSLVWGERTLKGY